MAADPPGNGRPSTGPTATAGPARSRTTVAPSQVGSMRTASRHPMLQGELGSSLSRSGRTGSHAAMSDGGGAPSGAATKAVTGDVFHGTWQWQIGHRLGSGGYGSVWHALRIDDGSIDAPANEAAVKLFHPPAGIDPTTMLRRELSALLALRSERIPRVLDWSVEGPVGFVAMQYHRAGSLYDLGRQRGKLPVSQAWGVLMDVLEALRVAHHAAVLHLDIKPGNVLIDDAGGYVLTDFGISQGSYVANVVGAMGLGTRGFQAPEQRAKEFDSFDVRTDLWGVGATVWAMVTGVDLSRQPEIALQEPDAETMAGLPRPSVLVPGLPKPLEDAILQLVAFDPVDRPGGAAEALAMVRRQLSGHRAPNSTAVELRGRIDPDDAAALLQDLHDPLWQAICGADGASEFLVRYEDGELMCREGERSYHTWALLRGTVRVERASKLLATIDREGTFLGEVAALTGASRTATMRAQGRVHAMIFNAAELEQFVVANPPVALRLIHSLASALERESRLKK